MLNTNRESGTAAILLAACLVFLMGMAAITIDYGSGVNERRQDQTGADLSVLGGALDLALGESTGATVQEILTLVDTNVRPTSLTQWQDCVDPDALIVTAADLGLVPATDCISFDTFSHIRVRVPNQETATTFARVIGTLSIVTSASAESTAQLFPGEGTPPPFAVLAGFDGGDVVCLRDDPASSEPPALMQGNGPGVAATRGTEPDPCDESEYDNDTEMFGLLAPYSYFDENGEIACKQNVNDYFIAAGVDHPLSSYLQKFGDPYDPGDPEVEDGDGCGGNPKSPVNGANTIPLNTGLNAGELRCGMLTSRSGQCADEVSGPPGTTLESPARLHKGDHVQSTYTFLGEDMDNAALWEFFIKDSSGDVDLDPGAPVECQTLADAINNGFAGPAWDYYDKRDALLVCLTAWDPASDAPLFDDSVWSSSRFAFVPRLAEASLDSADPGGPSSCPTGGGDCVHIDDFVPVWLQSMYTSSPDSSCDDQDTDWGIHHAGQENSCGNANGNLDRLSSIVLDCGMLSQDACTSRPGPPGSPGGNLIPTIRLTK